MPYKLFNKPKKFITIDNLSSFIYFTLDNKLAFNKSFNICDDNSFSVYQIISKISYNQNLKMRFLLFDKFFSQIILIIPILKTFYKKIERELIIDDSYTKNTLKWKQPLSLMECLDKYFFVKQ